MNCKVGIELVLARNTYMGKRQINVASIIQLEGKHYVYFHPLLILGEVLYRPCLSFFSALPPFSCSF